jgi:hypothetical protein
MKIFGDRNELSATTPLILTGQLFFLLDTYNEAGAVKRGTAVKCVKERVVSNGLDGAEQDVL